jgi:hypothetical protein
MGMKQIISTVLAVLVLIVTREIPGVEAKSPPQQQWDQKKAEEIVARCVAVEQSGQPWDKIAWLTDPDVAIARARKEDKPIFIFAYVYGTPSPLTPYGPATAPC